ncbi:hypothetical protein D3C74_396950 [compost metagenome]
MGRDTAFSQIDNICFRKYAAFRGYMMQFRIIEMELAYIFHRKTYFNHTFVDRSASARCALVVHRRHCLLAPGLFIYL